MVFNILYDFLARRTFKPTTHAACRVYMAKNLKNYSPRYYSTLHQVLGARWNPIMQNIDYDSLLIKKVTKVSAATAITLIFMYVYLF